MSCTFSRISLVGMLVFTCACEVEKIESSYAGEPAGLSATNNSNNTNDGVNFGDSLKLFSEPLLKVFSVQDCSINKDIPNNVDSAIIDVTKVRLRSKDGGSGSKWFSKDLSESPLEFDLGNLGCAVWRNFNKFIPPPGTYDHIRLETVEEGLVVHDDGEELPLRVPSGEQTGIKIFFNPPIVVELNKVTVCVFNYDREKSIQPIPKKNPNRYQFKPVVKAECKEPINFPDDESSSSSSSSEESSSSSSSESSESSSSSSSSSVCDLEDGIDQDPGAECLSDYELPVEEEPSFMLLRAE